MVLTSKSKSIIIFDEYDPVTSTQAVLNHPEMKPLKYETNDKNFLKDEKEYLRGEFSSVKDLRKIKEIGRLREKYVYYITEDGFTEEFRCDLFHVNAPKMVRGNNENTVPEYMRHVGYSIWPINNNTQCYVEREIEGLEKLQNCAFVRGLFVTNQELAKSLTDRNSFKYSGKKNEAVNTKWLERLQSLFNKKKEEEKKLKGINFDLWNRGSTFDSFKEADDYWNNQAYNSSFSKSFSKI